MKNISDSYRLSLSTLDQSRPFSSVDKAIALLDLTKVQCMYVYRPMI